LKFEREYPETSQDEIYNILFDINGAVVLKLCICALIHLNSYELGIRVSLKEHRHQIVMAYPQYINKALIKKIRSPYFNVFFDFASDFSK